MHLTNVLHRVVNAVTAVVGNLHDFEEGIILFKG